MCGRTASDLSRDDLARMLEVDADQVSERELPRSWDVAPSQVVYAVEASPQGGRRLVTMRWGLVPAWSKPPARAGLINARAETVLDKPAFRDAVAYHRALVPVSGFYEWHRAAPGRPRPYYFCRADGQPMVLAAICEASVAPGGEITATCALLTTAANRLMAPVHDRMPVVLGPAQWDEWLARSPLSPGRLAQLTAPAPDELLEAYPVGKGGLAGGPDFQAGRVSTASLPAEPAQQQLSLGLFG